MPEKTPEPQSEKKHILAPEDRLTPELRAELEPVFRDAVSENTIPPMADLRYALIHAGIDLSELDELRLFWELVGNELGHSVFPAMQNELELLVNEGKTKGLEKQIDLLMAGIVKDVSPATYQLHEAREVAAKELKQKFLKSLPSNLASALALKK